MPPSKQQEPIQWTEREALLVATAAELARQAMQPPLDALGGIVEGIGRNVISISNDIKLGDLRVAAAACNENDRRWRKRTMLSNGLGFAAGLLFGALLALKLLGIF